MKWSDSILCDTKHINSNNALEDDEGINASDKIDTKELITFQNSTQFLVN